MPPLLDVTEVLADPDLADTFTVVRRVETVGNNGRSSVVETSTTATGVVTAAGPNDLERLDDQQRMGKVISIVTAYLLRGPSKTGGVSWQPDKIVWNSDNYVVATLDDYSRFGAGHVQALAVSMDAVDIPPP